LQNGCSSSSTQFEGDVRRCRELAGHNDILEISIKEEKGLLRKEVYKMNEQHTNNPNILVD
jgi:hypothetical protein